MAPPLKPFDQHTVAFEGGREGFPAVPFGGEAGEVVDFLVVFDVDRVDRGADSFVGDFFRGGL